MRNVTESIKVNKVSRIIRSTTKNLTIIIVALSMIVTSCSGQQKQKIEEKEVTTK